jgi:hypothetical protein
VALSASIAELSVELGRDTLLSGKFGKGNVGGRTIVTGSTTAKYRGSAVSTRISGCWRIRTSISAAATGTVVSRSSWRVRDVTTDN